MTAKKGIRKTHSGDLKAKVSLGAIREVKTINEIAQTYGVHPEQVRQWKKELIEQSRAVFENKRGPKTEASEGVDEKLYSEIGRLKMELDWLKKSPAYEYVG